MKTDDKPKAMKKITWEEWKNDDDNFNPDDGYAWTQSDAENAFNARNGYIEYLESQLDELRMTIPHIDKKKDSYQKIIADLEAQNKRYREALEFYARDTSWVDYSSDGTYRAIIENDLEDAPGWSWTDGIGGKLARTALQESENQDE